MGSSDENSPPDPWIEPPVRLRSYQQEMLDWALQQNVIIAMDTGSGKTHIAIGRIAEELKYAHDLHHPPLDKIVWFMCPSVALCMQQYDVLVQNLPGNLIKTLTGNDGVDKWTTQDLWDGFLMNTQVVVCTPKVLEEALTHGFVKIRAISMIVFDEAHRCIKSNPMNVIMQKFYHPAKHEDPSHLPHVLGLTASPVMSEKSSSLETIEASLDAKAITPKVHRSELELYVHPPQILRIGFQHSTQSADTMNTSPLCAALKHLVSTYDVSSDPWLEHLRERDDASYADELQKQLLKPSTRNFKQLKMLHQRASSLIDQLGCSAAEWYVERCIQRYTNVEIYQDLVSLDLEEHEKRHLQQILLKIRLDGDQASQDVNKISCVTEKMQALIDLLNETQACGTRVIVFAEQRAVVSGLAHLLRSHDHIGRFWSIGSFVGTSSYAKRNTALTDLVELKEQEQDLKDFRSGDKNLIVTTSVLEEGIDVSECNVIICFDPPKNLVSFIQRRGRARKHDSKYVLFVEEQEHNSDHSKWEKLEADMKQAYMDDSRQLTEAVAEIEDESVSNREYRVPSTGALLTTTNAKAHLYHFCAVSSLHASRLVDVRPEFATTDDGTETLWTATVTLPSFVHQSLRRTSSTRSFRSEAAAMKDAAFESYVKLHREGLVNDNLLPLLEDPQFTAVDQPSIIDVAELQNSWKQLFKAKRDTFHWHAARLEISCRDCTLVAVTMWLPTAMQSIQPLKLYWNEDTEYIVEFRDLEEEGLPDISPRIDDARVFTNAMLRLAHGAHMTRRCDFPVLFSPTDSEKHLINMARGMFDGQSHPRDSLYERFCRRLDPAECGLVRVRSLGYKPYFFAGFTYPQEDAEPEIELTSFPKRKDFLHPVEKDSSKNAAYTAIFPFKLSDCEFDLLPARFAVLAAFVPSIMHRLSVYLLAQDLQNTVMDQVQIENQSLITEAISSPSAGEEHDYNRLEFLGDSILKFCASLQMMAQHLNWPERYLTQGKEAIVSNNALAQASLHANLDRFILTKPFTGKKWRPQTIESLLTINDGGKREISSKVVADVVEALIGASYVDGGLDRAFNCIRMLMPGQEWYLHAESVDRLLSDTAQMDRLDLKLLERVVGRQFNNKALLLEAMTHASCSSNTVVPSYERLEFLGDAVLDLIIVPQILAHSRKLRHWELHRLRNSLANSHFLGYCCMKYGIEQEIQNPGFEASDIRKEHPCLEFSTRTVHLYDFMHAGAKIHEAISQSVKAFHEYGEIIHEAMCHGEDYPWADLTAMNPQKFFSDLVESVLCAIFLDTRGDISACEAFVDKLGILQIMRRILDEHVETAKPKEQVGILADRKSVEYIGGRMNQEDGRREFVCMVKIDGEEVAHVHGCRSAQEAETRAAFDAVKALRVKEEEQVAEGEGGTRKKRKLDLAPIDLEPLEPSWEDLDMDIDGGA